jgi:TonB family protein
VTFEINSLQRLIEPLQSSEPRRKRFGAIVGVVLLCHLAVLAALVIVDAVFTPRDMIQETPVEVIVEPPAPPPQPPPPPKEEEKPEPKPEQQKPPQSSHFEEPGVDAPRAPNKESVERPAPDDETKALRKALPSGEAAQKPTPQKQIDATEEAARKVADKTAALKKAEDKPEAEIIEQADIDQKQPPEKEQLAHTQGETRKGAKSLAEELMDPDPAPKYMFSGAAKASPVSGGKANSNYLSILWGMIIPGIHMPERVTANHPHAAVIVVFSVDIKGNLTGVAVKKSSGLPDLDAEAVAGVRRAAPFPPPPRGFIAPVNLHYTSN